MTTRKASRRKTAAKAPPSAGLRASGRRNHLHVASRIFNTPLLIDPRKLAAIVAGMRDQMNVAIELPAEADFVRQPMAFDPSWDDFDYDDWMTVTEGVAVLHIDGTLVHKGSWLGTYSGLISYDGISEQLARVRERHQAGEIGALLLNMHTHGGEVAGCFDLVDELAAMRGSMPIWAIVADAACSAGYAIASAADEIIVTQAGYGGSIGVVYTHYDYTGYAEKQGIAVTHIYAGKEKILGSPFKELSDSDKAKLQAEIDDLYEIFVKKVATNRGMSEQAVRATEAGVFYGSKLVAQGLADRVGAPREVLAELQARIKSPGASTSRQFNTQELTMTTTAKTTAANEAPAITAEHVDAARAEGKAEGLKEGTAKGASDERVRIKAILTSAEAEGRKDLAHHLAFETDTSAEAAVALLGKAPKAEAKSAANALEQAMAAAGKTGVGAEASTDAPPVRINANAIYEQRRKAAGH